MIASSARGPCAPGRADGRRPSLTVVVPTRGAWPTVAPALHGLHAQIVDARAELLVVDGTDGPPAHAALAWSPDGSRIVFAGGSPDAPSDISLYVANADGSGVEPLTTSDGRVHGAAAWSPDGRFVAYESYDQDGSDEIFVVSAAGGKPERLTDDPLYDSSPEWLDDEQLVFTHDGRLARLEVETKEVTLLSEDYQGYNLPDLSPDGETLLVSKAGNLYTASVDGTDVSCVPAGRVAFTADWFPG